MGEHRELNTHAVYQITVRGRVDERWSDWFGGIAIVSEEAGDGSPVTTLTGILDHAALHGIMSRIRDLNLTLVSVTRLESEGSKSQGGGESDGKTL